MKQKQYIVDAFSIRFLKVIQPLSVFGKMAAG